MRLTVRTRFALLSALLVLAVGALVATAGYVALRRSLLDHAGREARDQARQLAALVDVPGSPPPPGRPQNRVDLGDPSLSHDFVRGGLHVTVARPSASSSAGRLIVAISGTS